MNGGLVQNAALSCSLPATFTFGVAFPSGFSPVVPIAVIRAPLEVTASECCCVCHVWLPTQVDTCSRIVLDAQGSLTYAARSVSYIWQLVATKPPQTAAIMSNANLELSQPNMRLSPIISVTPTFLQMNTCCR